MTAGTTTRWSVKRDRLVAAIARLQVSGDVRRDGAAAVAARMELRRRLEPAAIEQLVAQHVRAVSA